jgi:hypothetical protein
VTMREADLTTARVLLLSSFLHLPSICKVSITQQGHLRKYGLKYGSSKRPLYKPPSDSVMKSPHSIATSPLVDPGSTYPKTILTDGCPKSEGFRVAKAVW